MKKHFIATAVAAVFAVPAMAQNVTISGYLETGYLNSKTENVAGTGTMADSQFGTSRLLISGSEDLGGGMKAGFRLETDIALNNDSTTTSNGSGIGITTKGFWSRGAELNLSGNFGMVRLGKFDHQGVENNDLNVVGNVGLFTGSSVEFGSDLAGSFAYRTPTFNGIYVEASKGMKDQTTGVAGGSDITSYFATGAIAGVNFRAGTGQRKASDGTKETVRGVAVSYDFGIASASVGFQMKDNPGATADRDQLVVSVKAPLGNGLDAFIVNKNLDVEGTAASDSSDVYVGLMKALSKRTTAYAYYRNTDNGGTTADAKSYFIGIGHSF